MKLLSAFRAVFAVLLFAACIFPAFSADDDLFPTPEILQNNVTFWKMVYTELSLYEGVLQDYEFPMIIYDRFSVGGGHRSEERTIRSRKARVIEALQHIAQTTDSTQLNESEKLIVELFTKYTSVDKIAGAAERLRFQRGQKERFKEGLERSGAYIDTIKAIFAQYGVPERVAYLPHVESSFNTYAYSRVGAAGMWQFMRYTGRLFMRIDYQIDERRDPIIATRAAARLLRQNYNELQSWPLAITAYNHGLNGMKRAKEATGSGDIAVVIEKYQSPSFQFASKNFYSCFLAASSIAMDPSGHFPTLSFKPKLARKDFVLTHYMKPATLCSQLGISEEQLMEYNLSFRPVVFSQQRQIPAGYTIYLPATVSEEKTEQLLAAVPESLESDTQTKPAYYQVRRGDNLMAIASNFQTSIDAIAQENALSSGSKIFAGQVLAIPFAGTSPKSQPAESIKSETDNVAAVVGTPETLPKVKAVVQPIAPFARTFAGAPKKMSSTLGEMALSPADTQKIEPATEKPAAPSFFDADVYGLETIVSAGRMADIRVSVDETIGHYAEWLGIPAWRIRNLNHFGANGVIRIGQRLTIPCELPGTLDKFVQSRLEYHMAIEEDFYAQFKVSDVKPYIIKRGEALWDICNGDDQIPLWLFKKYNKQLDLTSLMPGTQIWLPVIDEKTAEDMQAERTTDRGKYPAYQTSPQNDRPFRRLP